MGCSWERGRENTCPLPLSDQGKLHTYACGFVLLCSCVLFFQSGSCLSLPLHVPFLWLHSLGAPSFGIFGGIPAETGSSGTVHSSHCPRKWQSTCPASPPPHLGLFLHIPHPHPCSGSVTVLSTSLEVVSKPWETAVIWGAPAAPFPGGRG